MKRATSVFLILCMLLSFSACTKEKETTTSVSETEPSQASPAETEPSATTETSSGTETDATTEPPTETTIPDPLPVDNTYFPDPVFLQYVTENIDTDSDGFLSSKEREAVNAIEINGTYELASLVGIEHFPNMTDLSFEAGYVTTLDASKNPALEFIDCYCNNISEMDLSGCANLENVSGQGNPISNLNISGCTSLEKLDFSGFTDIQILTGISDCKKLKSLSLGHIDAKLLNISALPELESLWCIVDDFSELDLSHNPKLKELRVTATTGRIDLSQNPELKILEIGGGEDADVNLLSDLDLSRNPKLEYFSLYGTQLRSIDLSNNPELESGTFTSNPALTELDFSSNPKLNYLYCYENGLTSINISNCPELEDLTCSASFLTEIDISGNPKLRVLGCSGNKLTSLDTSTCPLLAYIICSDNELTSLDVSKNIHLRSLEIYHNDIAEINVHGIDAFRKLEDTEPIGFDGDWEGVCEYSYEVDFDSYISIWCDTTTRVIF